MNSDPKVACVLENRFFCRGLIAYSRPRSAYCRGFMITLGTTALGEWSDRSRDLYLTTHNTHNRQTSMSPVGFETAILISQRPQTHALDRTATGIGKMSVYNWQ